MASGAESLQLFEQLVANANSLFLSDEDFVVINGTTKPTLKKIYAEFLASLGVYPTVADGLANTSGTGTNNRFFTVPATGDKAETRYRNDAGVAVEINSILSFAANAVTVNRGKAFPLKQMTRGGVTSAASATFNNLILDVKVVGDEAAIDGKYFRIAYFQNDATISGNADQGIVIEQFDAATYASTGTATIINNHTDAPASIVRTGGVQTFVIVPPGAPFLRFIITIDAAALPAAGTPVNALTSANAHYSWIIDQSCYLRVPGTGDSLTTNRGRVYPLKKMARNGSTSAENVVLNNAILDVRVSGARPGKYYRVSYFVNESTALPGAKPFGWIIDEIDQANYTTADNPVLQVITLYDANTPTLVRDGIQTINLVSTVVVGMVITITLDTAKLPAAGTPVTAATPIQPAYSFIIDPSRYVLAATTASGAAPLSYTVDAQGRVSISWNDGVVSRGFVFGSAGANNLPNIYQMLRDGVVISTYDTDWLPPMVFDVASGGDSAGLNFTGGNHLVSGAMTAINVGFDIEADGVPVTAGASGRAERISCRVVNKLMAGNTVTLGRYALIQSFQVDFEAGVCNVHADVLALEDLQVYIDYGPQMVATGVNSTLFYLGGQLSAPVAFDNTLTSGSPSAYPDAWAALCTSSNGQIAAWIDRNYGVADGSQVYEGYGLIIGGSAGSSKQYPTAIHRLLERNTVTPNYMPLPAGKRYQWRGGYSWGPVDLATGFVASMRYLDDGKVRRADALSGVAVLNP